MNILIYCVPMAWALASGPVDHYSVYRDTEDIEIQSNLAAPPTEVCLWDGNPHRFAVRAFAADGTPGPLSDWSEPIQRVVMDPIRLVVMDDTTQADLDGNGIIGWSDFTIFVRQWGKSVPIR